MQNKKKVRIFAGPNGSGKSTLFVEFSKIYQTGFFVNADFIEKKLFESGFFNLEEVGLFASQNDLDNFKNSTDAISLLNKTAREGHIIDIFVKDNFIVDKSISTHSYEGAFIALFIRYLMTLSKKSFSYETVMSHFSKVEEIKYLIQNGYNAYLYFICVDNHAINISRVQNRIKKGGHSVVEKKIIDRYYRTLENLHLLIPICYRAYFFDNSGKQQKLIAESFNGKLELKMDSLPNWFITYVLPYYSAK